MKNRFLNDKESEAVRKLDVCLKEIRSRALDGLKKDTNPQLCVHAVTNVIFHLSLAIRDEAFKMADECSQYSEKQK
jgi:hypothetical protein